MDIDSPHFSEMPKRSLSQVLLEALLNQSNQKMRIKCGRKEMRDRSYKLCSFGSLLSGRVRFIETYPIAFSETRFAGGVFRRNVMAIRNVSWVHRGESRASQTLNHPRILSFWAHRKGLFQLHETFFTEMKFLGEIHEMELGLIPSLDSLRKLKINKKKLFLSIKQASDRNRIKFCPFRPLCRGEAKPSLIVLTMA